MKSAKYRSISEASTPAPPSLNVSSPAYASIYTPRKLGPAGDLYADSEGRSVAVYDWDLSMTKAK